MNITLPIQTIIGLINCEGCLEGVSLVNYIEVAKQIESIDKEKTVCYIEWYTPDHPILWTIQGWIDESKRRKDLETIGKSFSAQRHVENQMLKVTQELADELAKYGVNL